MVETTLREVARQSDDRRTVDSDLTYLKNIELSVSASPNVYKQRDPIVT